jgi:hypothetical protein
MKLKIADAGNVTVPAFLTLQQRGYVVRCERSADGTRETWIAESDTTELLADDPVALLGLAALAESRGTDWKASDSQIQEFLKKFGYDDVA